MLELKMKFGCPALILVLHAAIIFLSSDRSFVDGLPLVGKQGSPETSSSAIPDDNVRELQNLKDSLGNSMEIMQSHSSVYTNINGAKESHAEHEEEVDANGKLIARINQKIDTSDPRKIVDESGNAGNDGVLLQHLPSTKVRTEIDVPSQGVHKNIYRQYPTGEIVPNVDTEDTNNNNKRTPDQIDERTNNNNNIERYNFANGIQYSPLDMAEYVFWTGDEKGVTLAIEEFLQEGLMSREEAISFLQEIKYNLEYLQTHYTQLGLNSRDAQTDNGRTKVDGKQKQELRNNFDLNQLRREATKKKKKSDESEFVTNKLSKTLMEQTDKQNQQQQQEDEYEALLERLRLADFLYTEYSLEEIIYQLAKVMFTQSLTKGSAEAQRALQKFTTFLETEAEQGHLSKALEKKVLDVLIAALTDTLSEHPDLTSGGALLRDKYLQPQAEQQQQQRPRADGQQILRQILQMSPEEKAIVRAALLPYKDEEDSGSLVNNNNNKKLMNRFLMRNDSNSIKNQLDLRQDTYLAP